jgi:transglutaminase/protease-like cytokinesis protein 3
MSDNLKKAEQIAKDKVVEIAADVKATEAKNQTESTEAVKPEAKVEKTEGSKTILAEAEKKAENDARILSTKDEELSDEDKKAKAELVKAKEAKETPEDKIKRTQEATQKRIDEVISELKAEKAERRQDKEKIAELEARLSDLTKPKEEETKASKLKELFDQQTAKYLEEDKIKPREDRREMSKEEIEEWLLDDMVAAQEWLTDRNIRRREDKRSLAQSLDETPERMAQEFIKKQQESVKRLTDKYPDIHDPKSENYKLAREIIETDTKKYLESVDGPEQVMLEMDRRKPKTITLTQEELDQMVRERTVAEAQRIANLDEGITSSGGKKKMETETKTPFRQKQEEIARKGGISIEALDNAIKRRESIGVISSGAEEFNKD